jgi:DNA-binding NarL/FixJ family response regulator
MSRILIVEDNHDFAYGLRNNLEIAGYEVDAVGDGREAVEAATVGDYDLMILDLMLPGLNGYQVLRTLRERGFMLPVLVLSARDADHDIVRAFNLGADDYVTKPFRLGELLARVETRIRRLALTAAPFLNQVHALADPADRPERGAGNRRARAVLPAPRLTFRESQVYQLIREGLRDKAIARQLGVSVGTIKAYVRNIFMKLGIHHRSEIRSTTYPQDAPDATKD